METRLEITEILEVVETTSRIRAHAGTYDKAIQAIEPSQLKAQCPTHFSSGQRELVAALLTLQP